MITGAALWNKLNIVGRLWRRRRAGPPPSVLAGYMDVAKRKRYRFVAKATLAAIALFYGFIFGATGPFFLVQLLLPLAALAFLVLWLLPETGKPSPRLIEGLFFAFLSVSMLWPDYLAIALPGLPWITLARLTALPLAFFYISSLSQSAAYRNEIKAILNEVPLIWKAMAIFAGMAAFSVIVSDKPVESANRFFVALYAWVLMFFVACHVFKGRNRATWFCYLVWFCTIVICIITFMEVRKQALPWAGHIPSFLAIQDESVQRMLAPKVRGSTGIFRAQSKFASPLSMAEYLSLSVPFLMHLTAYHRLLVVRIGAFCTIPPVIWAIVETDARLGMVGLFLAMLLFILAWAIMRARERKDSLIAPVVLLGYPLGFAIFLAASFTIQRLRNMVWGSSAYDDSDQARIEQMNMGLPMILQRPWGYGIGRSGERLGFTNADGLITIDNYMLSIGLELGIVGFVTFAGMFALGAWTGGKEVAKQYDFETSLIVPASITLVNFLLIKTVLSQMENHALFFVVLGLTVALIYRIREHSRATPSFPPGAETSRD
jgi:hypothetical protein